jgi:secreted Zn-dependent insulinase-like peptidase
MSDVLSKYGGYNNAYTDAEITNYFIQMQSDKEGFKKALDVFSQFFISPMLDE